MRRQANVSMNSTATANMSTENEEEVNPVDETKQNKENYENIHENLPNTEEKDGNYTDNNYWSRSNISVFNFKEMEDILSELEL